MHAILLWTINDFLVYGNISGWVTKGYMACPVCNKYIPSHKLRSKIGYLSHRYFLPHDHAWRKSKRFDGKVNYQPSPILLTGVDVMQQLSHLKNLDYGKHPNNKKRSRSAEELNWTKKSILFELPYWCKLRLRHSLDVIHIEKNICDNILGTLLNLEGKTKDTIKARLDLEDTKIRKELHLVKRNDGSYIILLTCYTMSNTKKKSFCKFLKGIKFLDGILPIGMRGILKKDVTAALMELGDFCHRIYRRTLIMDDIKKMCIDISLILCKLEMIFLPAFFDVMVHLVVYLPNEALLGGPMAYQWMYPIQRFLGSLKRFVRNKACPEGSIAEAYVVKECLTFCSMYLRGIETHFNMDE
ncbi:uncharacterized protein [Elaeis guineensis]|uniref:uncharacterized protein n=1 Tax=Elaeis guineensis var. tenera TaxID=51953 RepID=UPI003C6D2624